jgi:hypothetical protein
MGMGNDDSDARPGERGQQGAQCSGGVDTPAPLPGPCTGRGGTPAVGCACATTTRTWTYTPRGAAAAVELVNVVHTRAKRDGSDGR